MYTVSNIDEEAKTIILHSGNEKLTLTFEQAAAMLRLSFARTYASIQGQEFEETMALHDTQSKHFTKTTLYVALSRNKLAEKIAIRD